MTTTLAGINGLLDAGKLQEAEREFEVLPAQGVDRADRDLIAGRILERQGRSEDAANIYDAILDESPDHVAAAFRLGRLADRFGDDETAIETYERCVAEPPVHVNAFLNLAVLYEDAERYDDAIACVECVLQEFPNHTRARQFYKDIEGALDMYYDEEQQRLRERRNAILETPISDFELSVRSRNCLKQMDIHVLGDLLKATEAELLAYKNFGETSLVEIKTMLNQKGLHLGQLLEESDAANAASVLDSAEPQGAPGVTSRTVAELELSVRSRKCLMRLGINTISELMSRSESELLSIKNFGLTSLMEIKRRLGELGLSLRAD